MYFDDTLFRFQGYLSGLAPVGSQPLDYRSPILKINPIWDEFRGDGFKVGVVGGIDRLHPDLEANYDTSYLADFDPLPQIADNPDLVLPTFFAGIIGADDNGEGLVGVAPDVTLVPVIEEAYDDIDILVTASRTERTNTDLSDFEEAAFGRGGLGVIVTADTPFGDSLYGILGSEFPTGELNNEFTLNALRHVITTSSVSAYGKQIAVQMAGEMTLVAAPVFTDASSTNFFEDVSPTIGLDPSGDLGAIQVGETIGFWQVLAETEIGEDIDTEDYFITISGAGGAAVTAGVTALMLEANPDLGWRDVQEILAYSARLVGPNPGVTPDVGFPNDINGATDWNGGGLIFGPQTGFGVIDPYGAVRLAEHWTDQNTSAKEESMDAVMQGNLPIGIVNIPGIQSFTFTAPEDLRIEHVSL